MPGWGDFPTEMDVVSARARRAAGSSIPEDVVLDRFGTGQEMGFTGVPVAAAYEAGKPLLAASPMLNRLFGRVAGSEQMVDSTTQRPTFRQAADNVSGVALGALSNWTRGWGR